MTAFENPPPIRPLPVLACINHSLNSTLRFREAAVRIGLPWIALLTIVNLAALIANRKTIASAEPPALNFWPDLALATLSIIAASSIAVNWHRYILRDEMPATLKTAMRVDAPVWNYAGYTLFTLLISILPGLVLINLSTSLPVLAPLALITVLLGAVIFLRLSVALPAKALELPGFGMKEAMQVTKGNMLRVAGVAFVNAAIMLTTLLAMGLLLTIVMHLPAPIAMVAGAIISMVANLFIAIFSISLVSSLYGFFAERRNF